MDFLGGLRKLLGIDHEQNVQQARQATPALQQQAHPPQLAAANSVQGDTVSGFTPQAGQFNNAVKYSINAQDPSVMHQDPAQFGYPEDKLQPSYQPYGDHTGFQKLPDGRAIVGGNIYPVGTQEDNFTFQKPVGMQPVNIGLQDILKRRG